MIINLKKCYMHLFLENNINFIRLSHLVRPIVSVLFFLCLSYHNYHDNKYNENDMTYTMNPKCKDEGSFLGGGLLQEFGREFFLQAIFYVNNYVYK